jgi:hypothetical protein
VLSFTGTSRSGSVTTTGRRKDRWNLWLLVELSRVVDSEDVYVVESIAMTLVRSLLEKVERICQRMGGRGHVEDLLLYVGL